MRLVSFLVLVLISPVLASGEPPDRARTSEDRPIPAESVVGRLGPGERHLVLSTMERGSDVRPGGWNLRDGSVRPAEAPIAPRLGFEALRLEGIARGSPKGDFAAAGEVAGRMLALGAWFYVAPGANVKLVGFQVDDAEGEALVHLPPANWTGWRWVETPISVQAALGPWLERPPGRGNRR